MNKMSNRKAAVLILLLWSLMVQGAAVTVGKWSAVKNNNWHVKFDSTASVADNIVTVKGEPGNFNSVASDWILADTDKPVTVSGWIRRSSKKNLKKTLVALDVLVKYTDGTFKFLVLKPVGENEAGRWVRSVYTFTPEKKIKNLRVLCLNYDAPDEASFKDVQVSFQDEVSVRKKSESIRLENKTVSAEFADLNGQFCLVSLFDKTTRTEYINEVLVPKNLWSILLKDPKTGQTCEADPCDVSIKKSGNGLSVTWRNIKIAGKPADFTAVATIGLDPGKAGLSFELCADLKDGKYKLHTVTFPVINGIKSPAPANDTFLFYPQDIGREMHDPSRNLSGSLNLRYGSWFLGMQYIALYGKGKGIYFDARDGDGWFKNFVFSKLENSRGAFRFEVQTQAPEGAEKFTVPFPVDIRLFKGNWFDAAMIYRQWATKQKWCGAGPLAKRKNYPHERLKIGTSVYGYGGLLPQPKEITDAVKTLRRSDYSAIPDEELYRKYRRNVDAGRLCNDVKKLMAYFESPIEVYSHPYMEPFGSGSPRFLLIPGIPESAGALLKDKCFFAPWTTIHRFDVNIRKYKEENARKAVVITENGSPSIEVADAVMKANMCSATDYWQNGVAEYTARLLKGNMRGIYYDELSSSGAEICYARNHNHHPGGGSYGLEGRRAIMHLLHEKFLPRYPDYYTSGEEACEYYIDVNDINSMSGGFFNDSVPAFQAVYHDYSFSTATAAGKFYDAFQASRYADKGGETNLSEFAIHACQFWTWGINPNRVRFDLPKFSPVAAGITKNMSKTMLANAKYLICGRMLRPPEITAGNGTVTTEYVWRNFGKKKFAAIWASAWAADDGSVAIALANASRSGLAPEISCDFSGHVSGECVIRDPRTGAVLYRGGSDAVKFRVPVPGYGVKVLEVLPSAAAGSGEVNNPIPPVIVAADHDLDDAVPGGKHTVSIDVENTRNTPVSGRISLTPPDGAWLIRPAGEADFSLRGGEKKSFLFTVRVPERNLKTSTVVCKAVISGLEKPLTFEWPIRFGVQPLSARKLREKPKYSVRRLEMDPGAALPETISRITALTSRITAGNPVPRAAAGAVWNERGLFLEFSVEDAKHVSPERGPNVWRGDCVQLAFGKYMPDQDHHLYRNFFFASIDGKPYVASPEDPEAARAVALDVVKTKEKIVYRVYIPTGVTGKLRPGMRIPLSFTVNENNGRGFSGWLEWTPGICNGFNPKAFGELILEK